MISPELRTRIAGLWMSALMLLAMLSGVAVFFAQEQLAEAPPKGKAADARSSSSPNEMWKDFLKPGVEVFEGNYVDGNTFLRLLQAFDIQAEYRGDYKNQWFFRFKDPADVERARQLLKKIDIPPRQIVLSFQLVMASDKPFIQPKTTPDLSLLNRLKQVFKFNAYQVLDRGFLTLNAEGEGTMYLAGQYRIAFNTTFIDDGKGVIKLRALTLTDVGAPPAAAAFPSGVMKKPPDLDKLKEELEKRSEVLQQRSEELSKMSEVVQQRSEEVKKKRDEATRKSDYEGLRRTTLRGDNRLLTTSLNIKNGDTVIVGSSTIEDGSVALITIVTATVVE